MRKTTTFTEAWGKLSPQEKKDLALVLDSSYNTLCKCANGHMKPSKRFAKAITAECGYKKSLFPASAYLIKQG